MYGEEEEGKEGCRKEKRMLIIGVTNIESAKGRERERRPARTVAQEKVKRNEI